MKEQGKNSPYQTNEETGSLPKKEFRAMIVKMIQNLGNRMEKIQETFNKDLEELKSKQFFVVLKKKKYIYIYIYIFIYLFIYFGCIGSLFLRRLSLVAASGGYSSLRGMSFSLQWLLLLQSTGSRCTGFSSCSMWAQ